MLRPPVGTSRRFWLSSLSLLALPLLAAVASRAPVAPSLLAGLTWRNIGPFRAGRVSAVTGAIGEPGVYYMGLPIGGVWKTTSGGTTWFPVFDSIKDVSSIGAVEVAPSNPDIVYVGTGGVNEGNGVYKSTDAGKSWQHLGMDSTRAIPLMLVDPKNPDVVIMAALGSARIADGNRGVFRTTDGGKHWTRSLYVDSVTGAENLAWAFDHPEVILATTIRRGGGRGGRGAAAGGTPTGSGTNLYKSTDEGVTWKELSGTGLPPLTGRVSVAVAMHTNAQRMFLIGAFGLYRSDDGGGSWRRMAENDVRAGGTARSAADDARIANGQGNYTSGVWVNSSNPDIVYTIATAAFVSTDGGKTFTGWKGAPGGDDPQVLWIDPTDGKRMLMGLDQGGTVSLDGGDNWSLWYNQPTAQIYHISVDNQWPYWIYGTQQDACAFATRARGDLGEVKPLDWSPNPGNERGPIVADPLNPKVVYALNMSAGIMKITYPSGQWINISPTMDTSLDLRFNNENPLVFNGTNPHELLAGFQYVMSTVDAGMHWRKISPDLGVVAGAAAPTRGAGARGAVVGATINAMASSSVAPGLLWVGMTNGVIQVTRDHGVTWHDISIAGARGPISSIDASRLDAGTAYVALRAAGEMTPSFYRTHDFGKSWTKIVNGMRTDQVSGSYAHVIRADPKKAGLLYAGTESAMYVSFDDGDDWQSLMLNLPNTSYRDIVVKDNDLIVATYGRSIWVLDDISPLRQMTPAIAAAPAHLFKPGDAIRVRREMNEDTPFPPEVPHAPNPPVGAILYYSLGARPAGDITIEILDATGNVVRHYSSAPIPADTNPMPQVPPYWLKVPEPLPTAIGTNRINWDLRYDDPPAFSHSLDPYYTLNAAPGETVYHPEGPLALPGVYTVKLTVDGRSYSEMVTVRNDPRSPATLADLRAQHDLQMKLYHGAQEAWQGFLQVHAMRQAVADVTRGNPPVEVARAAAALDSAMARVGGVAGIVDNSRGNAFPGPLTPNFAAINGKEGGEYVLFSMNGQLRNDDSGDMAPTAAMLRGWVNVCTDLRSAVTTWERINGKDLVAFNAVLARNNLQPIAAAPALTMPVCATPASSRR
ncbi:MAG TPA: hypothetical protein VGM77_05970 [Gemmatimonadales bacterium]|jgi:photosystem II stability/assembly factor-like uncharacterized protein